MGIGMHPSPLVSDPSKILYSTPVADQPGILFWKANVRAITVYVNGQAQRVSIGSSVTGAIYPTAVLDSGAPLILTTSTIANGIYGAIGVDPASDGNCTCLFLLALARLCLEMFLDYVPCSMPLNLTITLDNRPEIPLHPLDLTAYSPDDTTPEFCIGLIQAADQQLSQPDSSIGDMILGVPFLRNVYTVMAYSVPDANGSFHTNQNLTTHINPRLGLMSLTNPSVALEEFNTSRVLNQPTSNTSGLTDTKTVTIGKAKLSMGVAVLFGLLCFVGFCGCLFLIRYLLVRRYFRKSEATGNEEGLMDPKAAYQLIKKGSARGLSEDQLRQIRYDAYKRNTVSTASSDRTRVESPSLGKKSGNEEEFGLPIKSASREDLQDVWDPLVALDWGGEGGDGRGRRKRNGSNVTSVLPQNSPSSSPERSIKSHRRQQSDSERVIPPRHQAHGSVDIPLLSAQHPLQPSLTDEGIIPESNVPTDGFHHHALEDSRIPPPLPSDRYYSAQRNSSRDTFSAMEVPHDSYIAALSYPDALAFSPSGDADELVDGTSMAGVGTASRTNKIPRDSALLDRESLSSMRGVRITPAPLGPIVDGQPEGYSNR